MSYGWAKDAEAMAHRRHGTVSFWDVRHQGLSGSRASDAPSPDRDAEMAYLVGDGWTLEAIGELYGLSRERVHQCVTRHRKRAGHVVVTDPGASSPS